MTTLAVSTKTSFTTGLRKSLADNMSNSSLAALKMGTGDAIIHAYEDPTGLAIGKSMEVAYKTLSTVATGIEQSNSMLYIAEEGLKAAYNNAAQMKSILTKAKLGFMNDTLIRDTLSPAYIQLKAEMNRVADNVKFNGVKLLDGTGGATTAAGSAATFTQGYSVANATAALSVLSIGAITATTAGTIGGTSVTATAGTPSISGGTIATTGGATLTGATITGATITLTGATLTSTSGTATGNVTISGVTITIVDSTLTSGTLSQAAAVITLPTTISAANTTVTITTAGTLTSVTTPSAVAASTANASVNGITSSSTLTNGAEATSTFTFVSGDDLLNDRIDVVFPNIRLVDNGTTKGLISTLNTSDYLGAAAPTNLTTIQTEADANQDIALVDAMLTQLINEIDKIGAYELRFISLQSQLATAVEQLDLAKGAILNSDLAKENENASRGNVQVGVAIAMLKMMNDQLQQLGRLVS